MWNEFLVSLKSKVSSRGENKILGKLRNFKYLSVDKDESNPYYMNGMFPRVYKQNSTDIELTMFNFNSDDYLVPDAEYLDNVMDKFIRVITANLDDSKRFNRRNDREEIRRRLAMGAEDDYFSKIVNSDRPGRKPSLQSRLQSGMNLQICFMNDASSDTESPSSDSETCPKLSGKTAKKSSSSSGASSRHSSFSSLSAHPYNSRPLTVSVSNNNNNNSNGNRRSAAGSLASLTNQRPSTLSIGPPINENNSSDVDFFTKQARLQIEARMALAQAKDMAHMQMEIEKQKQKQSPITEVIRNSLEKVGIPFPPEKRRVSRQMLTDMNIAQLQIIINELHTQIELLNEQLVQYLMERDELHMSQDSMLVDIEDLTRYLGAKEQTMANEKLKLRQQPSGKNQQNQHLQEEEINCISTKSSNMKIQDSFKDAIFEKDGSPIIKNGGSAKTISNGNGSANITSVASNHQPQSKFLRIASLVKK